MNGEMNQSYVDISQQNIDAIQSSYVMMNGHPVIPTASPMDET